VAEGLRRADCADAGCVGDEGVDMTKITIDRATVEQALEALERLQNAIYNIGGEHVTGLFVANAAADSAEKPMDTLRAAIKAVEEGK
jgi:formate dehydrogenase assembly factor FdhD